MYICSTCNRQFENADDVAKHSLGCWREHNPNHRSKEAPHSETIIERKMNDEITNFFASLQRK